MFAYELSVDMNPPSAFVTHVHIHKTGEDRSPSSAGKNTLQMQFDSISMCKARSVCCCCSCFLLWLWTPSVFTEHLVFQPSADSWPCLVTCPGQPGWALRRCRSLSPVCQMVRCYCYPCIYRKENGGSERSTMLPKVTLTPGTLAFSMGLGCLGHLSGWGCLCVAYKASRTRPHTGSVWGTNVCISTRLEFPVGEPGLHL